MTLSETHLTFVELTHLLSEGDDFQVEIREGTGLSHEARTVKVRDLTPEARALRANLLRNLFTRWTRTPDGAGLLDPTTKQP